MKTSTLPANILLTIGPAAVIAGVAAYDWRLGVLAAGVLLGAVGVLLAVATPAKVEPEEDRQWPPQRHRSRRRESFTRE